MDKNKFYNECCGHWEDENTSYSSCPKCGRDYDDADYDFQICHYCKWSVSDKKYV